MPKYCEECGTKLEKYKTGKFNIMDGEPEYDTRCPKWKSHKNSTRTWIFVSFFLLMSTVAVVKFILNPSPTLFLAMSLLCSVCGFVSYSIVMRERKSKTGNHYPIM